MGGPVVHVLSTRSRLGNVLAALTGCGVLMYLFFPVCLYIFSVMRHDDMQRQMLPAKRSTTTPLLTFQAPPNFHKMTAMWSQAAVSMCEMHTCGTAILSCEEKEVYNLLSHANAASLAAIC